MKTLIFSARDQQGVVRTVANCSTCPLLKGQLLLSRSYAGIWIECHGVFYFFRQSINIDVYVKHFEFFYAGSQV